MRKMANAKCAVLKVGTLDYSTHPLLHYYCTVPVIMFDFHLGISSI